MINTDIFYPYKILEKKINLHIQSTTDDDIFNDSILNFYGEEKKNINLKINAKIEDIENVLPDNLKNKYYDNLELILLIKSVKSLTRKSVPFEIKENKFTLDLVLSRYDWREDVSISSALVLKKDIQEIPGYASKKGTQLGWSIFYKILFDEPDEKEPGTGEGMDIRWKSFQDKELQWLNKHYYKDIYALDFSKGSNKLPIVYLNNDMDPHLKALLTIETKQSSTKNLARDLMYSNISSSILTQLITSSLIDFRAISQDPGEKNEAIDNAWHEILGWQRKIISNYASKLSPDSRKKDALENLKERLYEDSNSIPKIMSVLLNVVQNSIGENSIQEIFSNTAKRLTKKELS